MDELLDRAKRGDSEAFIALFEKHKQALWKTAQAVLENSADSADALQETTFRAWRAIPSFEGRSSVGTWLTSILLHICFDILRKRKREVPLSSEGYYGTGQEPKRQSAGRQHRSLEESRVLVGRQHLGDRDEAMDVKRALSALSPNDRLILTLFYVNDYSIKQLSALLDIAEGAVRTRLVRARERFREFYGNEREPEKRPEIEVIG